MFLRLILLVSIGQFQKDHPSQKKAFHGSHLFAIRGGTEGRYLAKYSVLRFCSAKSVKTLLLSTIRFTFITLKNNQTHFSTESEYCREYLTNAI